MSLRLIVSFRFVSLRLLGFIWRKIMTVQNRVASSVCCACVLVVVSLIFFGSGLRADCDKVGFGDGACKKTSTSVCLGCWANAGGNCQDGIIDNQADFITMTGPGGSTATPSQGICAIAMTCVETYAAHGNCWFTSCEGDPEEVGGCGSCYPASFVPLETAIFEMSSEGCGGG